MTFFCNVENDKQYPLFVCVDQGHDDADADDDDVCYSL